MEKTDTTMCLKKRNKDLKNVEKIIAIQKSLNISTGFCCYLRHTTNIIISKIVF